MNTSIANKLMKCKHFKLGKKKLNPSRKTRTCTSAQTYYVIVQKSLRHSKHTIIPYAAYHEWCQKWSPRFHPGTILSRQIHPATVEEVDKVFSPGENFHQFVITIINTSTRQDVPRCSVEKVSSWLLLSWFTSKSCTEWSDWWYLPVSIDDIIVLVRVAPRPVGTHRIFVRSVQEEVGIQCSGFASISCASSNRCTPCNHLSKSNEKRISLHDGGSYMEWFPDGELFFCYQRWWCAMLLSYIIGVSMSCTVQLVASSLCALIRWKWFFYFFFFVELITVLWTNPIPAERVSSFTIILPLPFAAIPSVHSASSSALTTFNYRQPGCIAMDATADN